MDGTIPRELCWPPVGRIVSIEPATTFQPMRVTYDTGTVVEITYGPRESNTFNDQFIGADVSTP